MPPESIFAIQVTVRAQKGGAILRADALVSEVNCDALNTSANVMCRQIFCPRALAR